MNKPLLSVRGLVKSYDSGDEKLHVIRNVDLDVAAGESVAVTGASGCGKSTLLNLIGGLDRPDSGSIISGGFRVHNAAERDLTEYRSRLVGFVFQFHYLLKDFTALENVMLPMVMAGTGKKAAAVSAEAVLERVGIAPRAAHYPSQLSGGERQRAALARALVNKPALILADEPTGNLDEEHKAVTADLIFSLIADSGTSLIIVTHAPDLARRAERRFTLRDGCLAEANAAGTDIDAAAALPQASR